MSYEVCLHGSWSLMAKGFHEHLSTVASIEKIHSLTASEEYCFVPERKAKRRFDTALLNIPLQHKHKDQL